MKQAAGGGVFSQYNCDSTARAKPLTLVLLPLLCWPGLAAAGEDMAHEEITVTSHRISAASRILPGVTVLRADDITAGGKTSLEEVLRQVPGIDVARTGGAGAQTSIFTRGTESDHTLVLLDGVPLNDPRTGAVDIAFIDLANVDRIEIIRGPQATLHGAMGGVIHIIRKNTAAANARARLDKRGYRLSAGGSAVTGSLNFYGNALKHYSEGISAAASGTERDGFKNTQLGAGISWDGEDKLFRADLNLVDSDSDLDDYLAVPADDPDYKRRRQQWQGSVMMQASSQHQVQQARLSYHDLDEKFSNGPAAADSFSDNSSNSFSGSETIVSWLASRQQQWPKLDAATINAGAELRYARGRSAAFSDSVFSQALWLQQQVDITVAAFAAGGRVEHHPEYGRHGTFNIELAVPVQASIASVSYGTGYRPPSISELGSPGYGNRELSPERSRSLNLGWSLREQHYMLWLENFHSWISDRVDYDFASMRLQNSGRARITGIELGFSRDWPAYGTAMNFNATRTRAIDKRDGSKLLRRPRYKWQLQVIKGIAAKYELAATASFVGSRPDLGGSLPSHALLDANLSWELSPLLSCSLRVDNILNENYQQVRGYAAPGREAFISLNWSL